MHHNDTPDLDPRTDITDLYVFQTSRDPGHTVLILDVYPDAPADGAAFDPQASYEIKIDTNGDFEADIAYHVLFTGVVAGQQFAELRRAAGVEARAAGPVGKVILAHAPVSFNPEAQITTVEPYHFFAGLRSEPFFADPVGFLNDMKWTGQDFWAGKNVFSIAVEAPDNVLGLDSPVGIWGRTMVRTQGPWIPVNQMGRPGNNVFKQDADLNTTPPVQQRERFLAQYEAMFQSFGYSQDESKRLALEWLPDILPYRPEGSSENPSGLNGRMLREDVVDRIAAILSKGRLTDDMIGPHTDYLNEFPYLGKPKGDF